ncbi:hypothetical protein KFK09_023673 [Dendrobium nobile]|uniref:Uncharacterized protein n=1 Tax=Dendrobium nobile TaxID=94219 RepID=A0A8T3ABX1_DENNO|nr:hypothetical protein KFK09_023673 [Dendrobium nobile]
MYNGVMNPVDHNCWSSPSKQGRGDGGRRLTKEWWWMKGMPAAKRMAGGMKNYDVQELRFSSLSVYIRPDTMNQLPVPILSDGEIDADIISRIQVGWLKWRNAMRLLSYRKVPLNLNGKFYKMVVRPVMFYGAECWSLKEKHNTKLSVAEMRMLRWMSGFTRRDRIQNDHICEKVGVAPMEDKIRESRHRWFGHIKWRSSDDPIIALS